MSQQTINRPDSGEYQPYYEKYVSLVPAGDVCETLDRQVADTLRLLRGLDETQGNHAYEPGKWSIKSVIGHVSDTERIFAYRALRFARGDATPLPGYDQDEFGRFANFDARTLADLADEFQSVRAATSTLLRSLDAAAWQRRGTANNAEVSVRALAHIIAGHELHHVQIIRERYL
ncbi:MAG TPA: DinB family protein [Pyrinomonadaceae bacterium]|jgi:uncharacterized damage-inducible protein DinB